MYTVNQFLTYKNNLMKKTFIIKSVFIYLPCCFALLLYFSCKKNDNKSFETAAILQFTNHTSSNNAALEKTIANIKMQLAQKDFSSDFVKWHGQPLWDKAVTLQKDPLNFIQLIPTQKNNTIETFIAVRLKDSRFTFELHRRSAMVKKITEPSLMNIGDEFRETILGYFNNNILGNIDNTKQLPGISKAKKTAAQNEILPDTYIQFCYNVGYCGPDACPPNTPEGTVCCITQRVCVNVWYNDGGGIGGGGLGGGGLGGGGGGAGGGGNPPPTPCPTSNWYSLNPTPVGGGGSGGADPCGGSSGTCFQSTEQAQAALAAITKTELFGVGYIGGTVSEGTNDTIFRANSPVAQLCNYNNLVVLPWGNQHVEYSAYFIGWNYKLKTDTKWKWKSIVFSHFGISDGGLPDCYTSDVSGSASVMITSPSIATVQIQFRVVFKVSCLWGYQMGSPDIINRTVTFDANTLY